MVNLMVQWPEFHGWSTTFKTLLDSPPHQCFFLFNYEILRHDLLGQKMVAK